MASRGDPWIASITSFLFLRASIIPQLGDVNKKIVFIIPFVATFTSLSDLYTPGVTFPMVNRDKAINTRNKDKITTIENAG